MKSEPKFYENWSDDNHCLQAAVMMVLNTVIGDVSWDEVNALTEHEKNLYSWASIAAVIIAEKISGTKLHSDFDYNLFAARGENYCREMWEPLPGWFELQKKLASPGFEREQRQARDLLQKKLFIHKRLTKDEIERLLIDSILIALIDAGKLAQEERTVGHFVLLYAKDDSANTFVIHNPGLPPRKAWRIDKELFMECFRNELIAIPSKGMKFDVRCGVNDPCWCGSGRKYKKCHGRL